MPNFLNKVLIASPIQQKPAILKEFLIGLEELDLENIDVTYYFVDDNVNTYSTDLLINFKMKNNNTNIIKSETNDLYIKDEYTHQWPENLINKVTTFKNEIITYASKNDFDYLFFVDSDLVLNPRTLKQLLSSDKDIISNIFWTKWSPNSIEMPQVWLQDKYEMFDARVSAEPSTQMNEFINKLRTPGTYKVGGLGACTLLSKKAIKSGVNFDNVYNISFWGEDRHFCIRAVVLGFELFVDTTYPAYHIYRDFDLEGVKNFKEEYTKMFKQEFKNKLLHIVKDGILYVENYSYNSQIDFNSKHLDRFYDSEKNRILTELIERQNYVISNKIINNSSITSFDIDVDEPQNLIYCNFEICMCGYKNFESYEDVYYANCKLIKNINGEYLIDCYNKTERKELESRPMIRYVRENPKLTLSMVVKNESNRYLKQVLESAREYIDDAIIIDDNSTDNTIELCREMLKNIPLTLIQNSDSKFKNEINLRLQQWEETIKINPDWILFLDADEIFEEKFKYNIKDMLKNYDIDNYMFRLYDFWDENHYRDDKLWCAHNYYRIFMIRYQKNFNYTFNKSAQHCGRLPANAGELKYDLSNLRLKHFGWSRKEDRINKYNRYMKLDPSGEFGSSSQYESILDEDVNLVEWIENS